MRKCDERNMQIHVEKANIILNKNNLKADGRFGAIEISPLFYIKDVKYTPPQKFIMPTARAQRVSRAPHCKARKEPTNKTLFSALQRVA